MSAGTDRTAALTELGAHIQAANGPSVVEFSVAFGELTVLARAEEIVSLIAFLRDDPRCLFQSLIDICGVDYPERPKRFEIVYHLLSMRKNHRVRVKVLADDVTPTPSLCQIFPCADWFEREAFDMYGVLFSDHPDLRRLLTDYGFNGYPLRKDFPLTGYVEVRYDPEQKRVVYEPVTLQQRFRNFDFLSPWEGAAELLPGDEKAKS